MDRKTITGAALAAAVGAMFMTTPVFAQSPPAHSASQSNVKCVGGNSCKGQSSCKSASNGCMGQNSCKGKGWVMATSVKACTDKGGQPAKPPIKKM
ncbi:MAG: BufA2 family periplasmic bufferin-type metallophore [Candidatus Binataceae bacterium]